VLQQAAEVVALPAAKISFVFLTLNSLQN